MSQNPFNPSTSGLQPNANLLGVPGAITATSTTQQTAGLGVLQFQIQPRAAFAPGMRVSIVSQDLSTEMTGLVVSYSGTTLTVNITAVIQGAGTFEAWYINLSAAPGLTGPAGATGATGATGTAAGPVAGHLVGHTVQNDSGTPSTKVDITATTAIMVNSSGTSVRATAVSVTIDLTTGTSTSAANGMDGEARGTSGWVYFYLINNGTTTAGLATKTSPLSGTPTLPSGYTYSVYCGAIYVDSSGNLLRTRIDGKRGQYVVTASSNTASMPVMGNGSAGSVTTPTWVGITNTAFIPPTASTILVCANGDVGGTPASVIVAPNNAYGNATSTNPPPVAISTGTLSSISPCPVQSTTTYWASSATDGYLFCAGWEDNQVAA